MAEFSGKVVLVTGAARGMGASHAIAFHRLGATVLIADVEQQPGLELAERLGQKSRFVSLDVTDELRWKDVVQEAEAEFGAVDVLVNNAGIGLFAGVLDQTAAEFRRVIDVNVTGVFLGMRAVLPGMIKQGNGAIVNISSVSGLMALPGGVAYGASKWAVRGLTKTAALDVAGTGVRINSVHPGYIATDMAAHVPVDAYAHQALPRMGTVDEVTQVVVFAASERASFCTGSEFVVDGGFTVGQSARDLD